MFIEDRDGVVLQVIERNLCRAELTVIVFSDEERVIVKGGLLACVAIHARSIMRFSSTIVREWTRIGAWRDRRWPA